MTLLDLVRGKLRRRAEPPTPQQVRLGFLRGDEVRELHAAVNADPLDVATIARMERRATVSRRSVGGRSSCGEGVPITAGNGRASRATAIATAWAPCWTVAGESPRDGGWSTSPSGSIPSGIPHRRASPNGSRNPGHWRG
jgi:hypothetical protein